MFKYIACFDLDRTILSVNSAEILIREAYNNRILNKKNLAYAYYLAFLYKLRPAHALKIMDQMTRWLEGIPESDFIQLSSLIVKDQLLRKIRPEILIELKKHREQGAGLVILSSSMFSICSPIAVYLGMHEIICSDFEVHNGIFTGRTACPYCFGEEKLTRLTEFCTRNNYTIHDCWYYADSFWDFTVLSKVGHPVCINPDKKLRKLAGSRQWQVYDWQ